MKTKFKLLVIPLLVLIALAFSIPNSAYSQEINTPTPNTDAYLQEINTPEFYGIGDNLEDLGIMIDYSDLQDLRFKNFEYELEKDRSMCVRVVIRYQNYKQKYDFNAFLIPDCYNIYFDEYVYAPTEIIEIGPEYSKSIQYFVKAIEESFSTDPAGKPDIELERLGLLNFLAVHFPNNPIYNDQLPTPTPTPTLTPTLTPTPTQTSTSTQTPTYTFSPTSTFTPTSTSTPEPTATSTPTQATFLIVTNNFINDLQEGENSYLLVVIVLILVLMLIGIGVIIYKKVKRR